MVWLVWLVKLSGALRSSSSHSCSTTARKSTEEVKLNVVSGREVMKVAELPPFDNGSAMEEP